MRACRLGLFLAGWVWVFVTAGQSQVVIKGKMAAPVRAPRPAMLGMGMQAPPMGYSSPMIYQPGGVTTPAPEIASDFADELALKAAGRAADGPALLDFFRQRTRMSTEPGEIDRLIRQLGDASAAVREKAVGAIVALGTPCLPALRLAVKDVDDRARVADVRRCLQALEDASHTALPAAAVRLLALRKPDGAAAVLLGYLPAAPDESVVEEVRTALTALAYLSGKPDAALVRALDDKRSLCRALAAEALCRARGPLPPALRKLLKDRQPQVRLRAALALADCKEPEAVTTLMALLTDLPIVQARQAEDYLLALAEDQAPKTALGNGADSRKKCRAAWTAWWQAAAGPGPLAELRKHSLGDVDREKVQATIRKLGDDAYDVREKAVADLIALGPVVVPALRKVADDPDLEIRQRAQRCLQQLGDKVEPLSPVTVRLLAYHRPAGLAEALLNYLPFAEDDPVSAEVQEALADVAVRAGKPDPAVWKALQDKLPLRRAAAGEALAWAAPDEARTALGGEYVRPGRPPVVWAGPDEVRVAVRKLLKDPDATVRLKVGLALAGTGDRAAIPVLIDLLSELPREQALGAEEVLTRLAGPRAPEAPNGDDADGRAKYRAAWRAWWRKHADKVELARAPRPAGTQRHLGYTLLVFQDNGQIQEVDRAGKVRWQLTGLMNPFDAQVLSGNRVLVCEFNAQRVTERDLKNNILWQKQANFPVGCQRLANGNTLIVTRNQVLEVDRGGKEVVTYNRPMHDLVAARKLRDGRIVCATFQAQLVWLDAAGKEVKTQTIIQPQMPCSIQALPNGNLLVPALYQNKVVEYDGNGKAVWETAVTQPTSATRLPNGNTLVSSQQWPRSVYEIDRAGKVVWEYKNTVGRVAKASRR